MPIWHYVFGLQHSSQSLLALLVVVATVTIVDLVVLLTVTVVTSILRSQLWLQSERVNI